MTAEVPPSSVGTDREALFIVVPAFNEERAIGGVLGELLESYPRVVVVDDGSSDDTAAVAARAGATVLRHPLNRGQGAALQTGIDYALARGAEVIVTFDSDGQHDAADVAALVEPVLQGRCDVALGSRFLGATENMPLTRRLTLKAGVLFTRVFSRIRVTDVHNGLRAFSRTAATAIRIRMDRMAHASEILSQIKLQRLGYLEIPVLVRYSGYSLDKGQSSLNAVRVVARLFLERLLR